MTPLLAADPLRLLVLGVGPSVASHNCSMGHGEFGGQTGLFFMFLDVCFLLIASLFSCSAVLAYNTELLSRHWLCSALTRRSGAEKSRCLPGIQSFTAFAPW